jgi:tetratricopeptide (TPR) repeat protein
MADELEKDDARAGSGPDPMATQIAMAASGAAAEEAREYLKKQSRLADLQIENLQKQDEYEISHLRWRRFNDQMKGAMQIMLVALGLLIVVAIAAAIWDASQAEGLVVDSFSAPPQLAAAGMDGDTLASDLTNKIGTVRDIANGNSLDSSADVRNGRNDIKVEIPDTGVSLMEVWRYLRLWLGHERHVSGYLRLKGPDKIALTVALDGARSITLEGPSADLDKLEQRAAERIFGTVDPVNYVLYLDATGRNAEALAQAARAVNQMTTPTTRADAYSLWSYETRNSTGNMELAEARIALAAATDPKSAPPRVEMIRDGILMGHDEMALQAARALQTFRREDQNPGMQGAGFTEILYEAADERDSATGDFKQEMLETCPYCSPAQSLFQQTVYLARSHDVAASRALLARATALGGENPQPLSIARYRVHVAANDWPAAIADARAYAAAANTSQDYGAATTALNQRTRAFPLLGEAQARAGDIAGARATIAASPRDCYNCVRVRGLIESAANKPGAAAYWFAQAVKQGPSIPFAYTDWGAMLLARGDYDGAIAKFKAANEKGPHFAAPLEMWGEALIAKNRSDLALAKLEEADKYAPNWGRLHLKWGEALLWSGKSEDARKQFDIAAHLDLSASDKAALARDLGTSDG